MTLNNIPLYTDNTDAIHEMESKPDAIIPMPFVEEWLTKRGWLFEQMELPPLSEDETFIDLSRHKDFFNGLETYYELIPACEKALQEYNVIVAEDATIQGNKRLMDWTIDYEQMKETTDELYSYFHRDNVIQYTTNDTVYFISGDNFKSVTEFNDLYGHLFWEEEILPDRIAKIKAERKEQQVLWNLTKDAYSYCKSCLPHGYCRQYPEDKPPHDGIWCINNSLPLKMIKFYNGKHPNPSPKQLCEKCNPIIFQVFFSDFDDGQLMDYYPDYFAFDFFNNEYGVFIADLKRAAGLDEEYNAKRKEAFEEWLDILYATPIEAGTVAI